VASPESTYSFTTGSPGPTLQPVITTWDASSHIYLFPPFHRDPKDVSVQVTLAPSWSFSAVYPSPQSTTIQSGDDPIAGQSLTWAVIPKNGRILQEKSTRTGVSYLYWAAE
jgi:hypothetical protein